MKRGLVTGVSEEVKKLDHSNFADTNDNGTATLKPSLGVGKSSVRKALDVQVQGPEFHPHHAC